MFRVLWCSNLTAPASTFCQHDTNAGSVRSYKDKIVPTVKTEHLPNPIAKLYLAFRDVFMHDNLNYQNGIQGEIEIKTKWLHHTCTRWMSVVSMAHRSMLCSSDCFHSKGKYWTRQPTYGRICTRKKMWQMRIKTHNTVKVIPASANYC